MIKASIAIGRIDVLLFLVQVHLCEQIQPPTNALTQKAKDEYNGLTFCKSVLANSCYLGAIDGAGSASEADGVMKTKSIDIDAKLACLEIRRSFPSSFTLLVHIPQVLLKRRYLPLHTLQLFLLRIRVNDLPLLCVGRVGSAT